MSLGTIFRRAESGQSLVEIAVTLPILTLLLLGGAELSRLAYASIEVTNAAKAAVQYGDQNQYSSDSAGMQTAATQDAANLTGLTATPSYKFQCSNAVGTYYTSAQITNTSCSGAIIEEILTVTTSATFNPLIHVPGLPATYTITGQATQIVLE